MILFLITFFFVFALICAKNIRYGIYAVIFSMPLYLVRFSIGGIPSTVLEVMIYILFLVWVLTKIKKKLLYKNFYPALAEGFGGFNRLCKNNFTLSIGIALLFLGLTISTFNSTDLRISLGIFKGWFVDPFLFFIVFIGVIKKEKHIDLVLKSWLFSGIIVSLISLYCLYAGELTFDGRLHVFYLSPNHLAMYLAPAFLIALFFLLNIKKVSSIKYQVLSVVLIIILIPLYLTYSYGAFLGIFVGAIWLFYKMYKFYISKRYLSFLRRQESTATINNRLHIKDEIKKQSNFKTRSFLKILAFIVFVAFISITATKFNQIINSDSRSSFHSRLMIWNVAGEIIKDNPILGIGPGTFQGTYLSYAEKFDQPYLEWAVPQPHNVFLAFYLQTGLIGFFGFVLILIWFFGRRNEAVPHSYNIINALMVYTLIHGLVDTTYWKNDLSLMFWLIIGMMFVEKLALDKN